MTAEIGPGSVVECVDARPPVTKRGTGPQLVAGAIYRIQGFVDGSVCRKCGSCRPVQICGMHSAAFRNAFCSHRFRPLGGDHETLEALKRAALRVCEPV